MNNMVKNKKLLMAPFLMSSIIMSCSRQTKDEFSEMFATAPAVCNSDPNYGSFVSRAKLCADDGPSDSVDSSCLGTFIARYEILQPNCKVESKKLLVRSITRQLSTKLDKVTINKDATLDLTDFKTWSTRAGVYLSTYSPYFSHPDSAPDETALQAQDGLSSLVARITKRANYYNSTYPFDKQMDGKPLASTELEILKAVVDTQSPSLGKGDDRLHLQFFGMLLDNFIKSQSPALKRVARAYDISCLGDPCSVKNPPDFHELIKLFASLSSASEENKLLPKSISSNDPTVASLVSLQANPNFKIYLGALRTYLSKDQLSPNFMGTSLAQSAREFLAMVNSYEKNALYFPYDFQTQRFSLDLGVYRRLPEKLQNYSQVISKRISDYQSAFNEWKQTLREKIDTENEAIVLASQIELSELDEKNLLQDKENLANGINELENKMSVYLREIQGIGTDNKFGFTTVRADQLVSVDKSSVVFDGTSAVPQSGVSVSVGGITRGRSTPQAANYLSEVQFFKISLSKGEILSGSIDGRWSPTCAIKKSFPSLETAGVVAGPEGFAITRTDDKFRVESKDKTFRETKYVDANVTAKACAGYNAPGLSPVNVSAEICASVSTGQRREWSQGTSSSEGSRFNETAAFQGGVLSAYAPVPKYPAGALLGFLAPSNGVSLSSARKVKVLDRNFSFVADEDSELYLAVNDCLDAGNDYGSLQIRYDIKKPTSELMQTYLNDLLALIDKKSKEADKALNATGDIGGIQQAFRSEILASFAKNHPFYNSLPLVREFFDYWIDAESLKLQRMYLLFQKEREWFRLLEEQEKLEQLQQSSLNKSFLVQVSLLRSAAQVDFYPLTEAIDSSLDAMTTYVIPLLKFHEDSDLGIYRESFRNFRNRLTLSTRAQDFANSLDDLLDSIQLQVAQRDLTGLDIETSVIAVRFPRPELANVKTGFIKPMDQGRSKLVWDQIFRPDAINNRAVELSFNDLYPFIIPQSTTNFTIAQLNCNISQTVVDSMLVALAVDPSYVGDDVIGIVNSGLSNSNPQVKVGPNFKVARGANVVDFTRINEGEELTVAAKPGLVKKSAMISALGLLDKVGPENLNLGISPFTSYSIDGGVFRELLTGIPELVGDSGNAYPDHVSDIILAFKVKSYRRAIDSKANTISNCTR